MTEIAARLSTALAGRYEILRPLGEGGMAVVFLARDVKHDRDVALKVLRPEFVAAVGAERFLQEIAVTAKLRHPHILPLHDSGEVDGLLFYVMPYLEGESLRDKLEVERRLSITDSVEIAKVVAGALDHAHRHGVVHRDIKPENILLQDGQAVVADFGIAMAGTEAGGTRLTETGVSVGTLQYMSPEQVTGDSPVDGRADIYALGAVLYEMLAGEPPHTAKTVQTLIARVLSESPVPLGQLRDTVPGHVEAAVHRSLAKTPADRFQSVAEFATAIVEDAVVDRLLRRRIAKQTALTWGLTVAVVVALSLAVVVWRPWLRQTAGITSVAVLPLENLSGDSSQDYFVAGIHDALIAELQQLSAFERVISRTSVMQYRDTELTIPEIATQLGVDAVADGSVQRVGNTVRVRVTLIGAFPERDLWADDYQSDLEDVLTQQRTITADIADQIALTLTPAEEAHLAESRPVDPEAFDLVLRGREAWNLRDGPAMRRAVEMFERALAIDAAYPDAHVGLSDAYNMLTQYEFLSVEEGLPLALEHADRALALDSMHGGAYNSLGEVHFLAREYESAERAYRRAIALSPGSAISHHFFGWFLSHLGRHDEAIAMLHRARELDPLSAIISADLAAAYLHARRYDDAWTETERTLRSFPGSDRAWHLQVLLDVLRGRDLERAIATAQSLRGWQFERSGLAHSLAAAGREAEARAILEEAIAARGGVARMPKSAALLTATVYFELGDTTVAWELMERAVESELGAGFTSLVAWPFFDPIRSDPRFTDLLDQMGYRN